MEIKGDTTNWKKIVTTHVSEKYFIQNIKESPITQ